MTIPSTQSAKSENPPAPAVDSAPSSSADPNSMEVRQQVSTILDRIRPAVQADGGDLEMVRITPEGVLEIRLHGACVGCPSSSMTLHMGVERYVREKVPQITAVQQVD